MIFICIINLIFSVVNSLTLSVADYTVAKQLPQSSWVQVTVPPVVIFLIILRWHQRDTRFHVTHSFFLALKGNLKRTPGQKISYRGSAWCHLKKKCFSLILILFVKVLIPIASFGLDASNNNAITGFWFQVLLYTSSLVSFSSSLFPLFIHFLITLEAVD